VSSPSNQETVAVEGPEVLVEHKGAAVWLTINRPHALNALTLEVADEMSAAILAAEDDPDVRAIVITAVGRAFCAGADLKKVNESITGASDVDQIAFTARLAALFNQLEASRLPVIAAVNGLALAGGLELMLVCDLVFAAESATIGDAHSNYGLLPGGGSSVRLPRRIGPTRAKYLLFTGDLLPASELEAAGLVNRVVPDEELDSAVTALVAKLAEKSPLGLARMKWAVNDGLEQPTATAMRLELALSDAHRHSEDMREGLAAFNEKRRPRFTGR
jgi:enoyl-CoA hydratase/carnithine racemase